MNISKNSFIEGTHCLPQHDSERKGDYLVGRSRLVGIVTGLGSCLWLIIPQLRESMSIGHIGAEYRLVILVMVDVLKMGFFGQTQFDLCFGFQIQMREQFRWESISTLFTGISGWPNAQDLLPSIVTVNCPVRN